ncbi:MAG: response regulator [Bacteriovoracaceae bacterium]|jgi:DNA-binding NtrC family response regulator|nr:response regulator [Bacteriovoracaceae bacterium]
MSEVKLGPIMIVDDEAPMLKLLNAILSERFEIHAFSDPQEAFLNIDKIKPLVILSDFNMPKWNGLTLLKNIKEKYPKMNFIILTGHAEKKMAIEALRAGAFDLLEKPFEEEIVVLSIKRALRNQYMEHINERLISLNQNLCSTVSKLARNYEERFMLAENIIYNNPHIDQTDKDNYKAHSKVRKKGHVLEQLVSDTAKEISEIKEKEKLLVF